MSHGNSQRWRTVTRGSEAAATVPKWVGKKWWLIWGCPLTMSENPFLIFWCWLRLLSIQVHIEHEMSFVCSEDPMSFGWEQGGEERRTLCEDTYCGGRVALLCPKLSGQCAEQTNSTRMVDVVVVVMVHNGLADKRWLNKNLRLNFSQNVRNPVQKSRLKLWSHIISYIKSEKLYSSWFTPKITFWALLEFTVSYHQATTTSTWVGTLWRFHTNWLRLRGEELENKSDSGIQQHASPPLQDPFEKRITIYNSNSNWMVYMLFNVTTRGESSPETKWKFFFFLMFQVLYVGGKRLTKLRRSRIGSCSDNSSAARVQIQFGEDPCCCGRGLFRPKVFNGTRGEVEKRPIQRMYIPRTLFFVEIYLFFFLSFLDIMNEACGAVWWKGNLFPTDGEPIFGVLVASLRHGWFVTQ